MHSSPWFVRPPEGLRRKRQAVSIFILMVIGISAVANAADLRCGPYGTYFSDWPSQWDHTLLSKSSPSGYAATIVVTKIEPVNPVLTRTHEHYGPVPLPAGQYELFNNKLLFWDRYRWVAIGRSANSYWLGPPQLWSYEEVLRIHSSPAGDGKGHCVRAQIREAPN